MATIPETLDLALQHHQAGRLPEAEALYQKILQVQPDHPDALHLLGVIAHQVGKHDVAVDYISRAIALNPAVAEYYNNIGEACRALGKLNEASAHYQRALTLKPSYAEAYSNLGIIFAWQGRLEEAVLHCRQALVLNPSFAEAHYNLGVAFQTQGVLADAAESYQRALALKPAYVDAQVNLAMALLAQGRKEDALKVLFDALTAQPANAQLRGALASSLHGYALHRASESVRVTLLSLCRDDNISMQNITTAIGGLVQNAPAFPPLMKAMQAGEDPFVSAAEEVDALMRDPLLLAALPRMVVCDPMLEQVLTHVRRWIVLRSKPGAGRAPARPAVPHPFLCALAMQCFNVQYAWFVANDEVRQINGLRTGLKTALQKAATAPRDLEPSLALVALYEPLHGVNGWERLLEQDLAQWSEPFQPIVREQLINHKREQDIAARLTALTEIKDAVSRKVRSQYEDNPYPRWMTIQRPKAMTVESLVRSLRSGEDLREYPRPVSILVAGCGTGQHPIQTAMAFGDCEVLAVDLSRASLAYAARMAERYGLANLTFQQADLLELVKLDRRFAVIECGGVLHHLKDPLKGWRVLVGLLEPYGLMKVGLYSKKARRHIQAARDLVRELNVLSTPDDIRKCRRAVINLPEGNPVRTILLSGDFYSISGCRDLIMHVQEKHFTLQDITECLDQLGLRFLGFQCDLQIRGHFRAMFPEKNALTDLALWDRFEEANPDTFTSMYQFWCCRKQER